MASPKMATSGQIDPIACNMSKMTTFVRTLTASEQNAISATAFEPLLGLTKAPICPNLIFWIIEHMDSASGEILVGDRKLKFLQSEIETLIGLKVTGISIPEDHQCPKCDRPKTMAFIEKYFGSKAIINRIDVQKEISRFNFSDDISDFVRLSLLYMLACFLIPNAKKTIDKSFIGIVYDLESFNKIAWGKVVHDFLIRSMKKSALYYQINRKHIIVEGCVFAHQIWAYEHFPELASPLPTMNWPRFMRYPNIERQRRRYYDDILKNPKTNVAILLSNEKKDFYKGQCRTCAEHRQRIDELERALKISNDNYIGLENRFAKLEAKVASITDAAIEAYEGQGKPNAGCRQSHLQHTSYMKLPSKPPCIDTIEEDFIVRLKEHSYQELAQKEAVVDRNVRTKGVNNHSPSVKEVLQTPERMLDKCQKCQEREDSFIPALSYTENAGDVTAAKNKPVSSGNKPSNGSALNLTAVEKSDSSSKTSTSRTQ